MNKMISNMTFDIPKMTYLRDCGRKSIGSLGAGTLWSWYQAFTNPNSLANGQVPGQLGWGGTSATKGIIVPWPQAKAASVDIFDTRSQCFHIPLSGPRDEDLLLVAFNDNTCILGKRVPKTVFRDSVSARLNGQQAYLFLPLILELKGPGKSHPDLPEMTCVGGDKSQTPNFSIKGGSELGSGHILRIPVTHFARQNLNDITRPIIAALDDDVALLLPLFDACPGIAQPDRAPSHGISLAGDHADWPVFLPHTKLEHGTCKALLDQAKDLAAWMTIVANAEDLSATTIMETRLPDNQIRDEDISVHLLIRHAGTAMRTANTIGFNMLRKLCPDLGRILLNGLEDQDLTGLNISMTPRGKIVVSGASIGQVSGSAAVLSAHEKLRLVSRYGDPLHARATLSALLNISL